MPRRAWLASHLQLLPRVNLLSGSVLLTCCRNYGVTNSEMGGVTETRCMLMRLTITPACCSR